MRRVVITGLGAITPIGNDINSLWESVKAGKCGIDKITHYDITDKKISLAGEVKDFYPEKDGQGNSVCPCSCKRSYG